MAFFVVLGLAYSAGKQSNGASMFDIGSMPSGASGSLLFALVLAVGTSMFLAWRLGSAILSPVNELSAFSERLAAGDSKARADVNSNDEFGYIAENLNRAVGTCIKSREQPGSHANRCNAASPTCWQ